MDYKKKIEYVEKISKELQEGKSSEEIIRELENNGLYERDRTTVLLEAQNNLNDTFKEKIRKYLLEGADIYNAPEFHKIEKQILDKLIANESQHLMLAEQRKFYGRIKKGESIEDAFKYIDTRFLSLDKAVEYVKKSDNIKKQKGNDVKIYFIIGFGFILFTAVILFTTGSLSLLSAGFGAANIVKGIRAQEKANKEDHFD